MTPGRPTATVGLLLAAGAGRRYGGPKALATDPDGTPWVVRTVRTLDAGGCERVVVVVGAAADEVTALLEQHVPEAGVVVAPDWESGLSASLRTGLVHLTEQVPSVGAALVHLVDLPDVGADVVRRLLDAATGAGDGTGTLARAAYDGRPGHPVLLGRAHWARVLETAHGDQGARGLLATGPTLLIECGDLADGRDRDHPGRDHPNQDRPTPDQRPDA